MYSSVKKVVPKSEVLKVETEIKTAALILTDVKSEERGQMDAGSTGWLGNGFRCWVVDQQVCVIAQGRWEHSAQLSQDRTVKTSRMNEMIEEGTFSFSPQHLSVGTFTDVIFCTD